MKEQKRSWLKPETPTPQDQPHEQTGDDLGAEIVIRFTAGSICSSNDFGKDQYFKSFDDLVKTLIKDEGLFGIVEDNYDIISIRAVKEL